MERALRKSATTKMVIIGSLGVVFGLALVAGGFASIRLLVLGQVFLVLEHQSG